MKVFSLETTRFMLDGGTMFGVIPKSMWSAVCEADENNMSELANRCLLVDNGNFVLLVDAGIGDKQDEKYLSHFHLHGDESLLKSLEKAGYKPEDISHVLFTHLHWDHCGGAFRYDEQRNIVPVFPNASYFVSEQQMEWALNPNKREKAAFHPENILPIKDSGRLNLVKENTSILPGVEVRLYNGHTRGQLIPFIDTPQGKLVFGGDLVPAASHVPLLWIASFDIEPMTVMREKEAFLNEAVQNNYTLMFEHDPMFECASLMETPKGARINETFLISEKFQ
jgi:glyoxylase-like metal-dependent hydrolase (beta-lactamase superfamily II)